MGQALRIMELYETPLAETVATEPDSVIAASGVIDGYNNEEFEWPLG